MVLICYGIVRYAQNGFKMEKLQSFLLISLYNSILFSLTFFFSFANWHSNKRF